MAHPSITEAFGRLVDIMARLRAPGGCPWDREQTPASLRPYLLEETHEVLDALERGRPEAVREELGDLLLQIVFQAEIAAEAGSFTIADVARGIAEKLVRRHPHVFGDVEARDAAEVVRNWKRLKAEERRAAGCDTDVFARVPGTLPALARAQDVGEKVAQLGFDWPDVSKVGTKLREEYEELDRAVAAGDRAAIAHELGDVLLTLTSVARHLEVSAEMALRDATARLVERLAHCEAAAAAGGARLADLPEAERERLWMEAKAEERVRSRGGARHGSGQV